jgi:hypothetical protein
MTSTLNYYGPHATKKDYSAALKAACSWLLEDPEAKGETPTAAARIYRVKEDSVQTAVYRARQKKQRNADGLLRTHGGGNRILLESQEEAIRQYCYEQWEAGLGATHGMVFAAICQLLKVGINT